MVSSIGSGGIYSSMQTFSQQRGNAAASGLAQASAMSSSLFGADPSTNAALAIFGVDTASSDSLFANTAEMAESSMTIAMARAAWAKDTPTKADERTAEALSGGSLGSLFDMFA